MKRIRSLLNKVNFAFGRNPEVQKTDKKFIPHPYKAVLIISADFELAWASRYSKSAEDPYKRSIENAKRARKNIPDILDLCDINNIPITWATVGHLFLEKCSKKDGKAHPEMNRLDHFENEFWNFRKGDWFDLDPCTNWKEAPEWYAPDIIKDILNRKTGHEIGCHTFSHIDCRDEICTKATFTDEIKECKKLAEIYNIKLRSFVHPAHTIGNLDNLAGMGFTNFRTNYRNVLGYPKEHSNGLWEFEQTSEFVYRKAWSIDYHIHRYTEIINRAIKSNTVCYFWFHPSFNTIIVDKILPHVFTFIKEKKNEIWVTTHREYVNWIKDINI